jgi:hypothetical protein
MKHLFLSYSRKDTDAMSRVRDTLRAEGFEVWTDEKLTPGTTQWNKAIQQAIADSFGIVVLLSPDSKASDWVANEIAYAETHSLPIFPILVRGEQRDSVPIELIRVQRTDIRTRFLAQMQNLVDILQEHLQSQEEPEDQKDSVESKTLSEREQNRLKFWYSLIERSKTSTNLIAVRKPNYRHWFNLSSGRTRISFSFIVGKTYGAVELYIDYGTQDQNKKIFDLLYQQKKAIEEEFGSELEWHRIDDKRASRIYKNFYSGGLDEPTSWSKLQEQMIEGMLKFDSIFRQRLKTMKV